MVDTENIHKISQMGTGSSLAVITDNADFPHTGLIKALNQMSSGNIVVKTGADFDINQTGGNIVVDAGKILRNGMYHSVNTKTFADTDLSTSHDKGYHLLVVADGREGGETVNNLYLRTPTAANVVADFKLGDTIVAMIEYASTTSAGSRLIQFFTTSKEENGLSIAYANSNVYTEVGSIIGASAGTTITSSGILTLDADDTKLTASANAKPTLSLENTTAISSAATPPAIEFKRSGTPAQSGDLGMVTFVGKDSDNDTDHEYVRIFADMQDETEGTEDGRLIFNIGRGSNQSNSVTNTEMLRLSGGEGIIFNYQKNNVDFEIRGDTNDNVFIADAGTESVGIGATPITNARLTVEGVLALDEVSAPTNTADYGQLYANADNDLHYMDGAGTDTVLLKGGKHTIWIPASSMTPTTTAGCANLVLVEMTASRPELQVLDFAADADDHAQFTVAFPKSWNEGAVNFQPFWTVTGTNTGDVEWNLTGTSIANNGVINTAYPTASVSAGVAHSGTSNDLNVGAVCGGLTIGNAAVDTVTYFKLSNDTGASTQTGVARLIGIKLFYDIVAGNDE